MQAGKLRHKVTLKTSAYSQNEYGEPSETWTSSTTLWARIEPLRGRELLLAQQVTPEASFRVTTRYDSSNTIDPAYRLYHGSRVLEVVSIQNPEEKNEFVELLCKELP
jgi:SPP1 family predicted phage head-tail adaptor